MLPGRGQCTTPDRAQGALAGTDPAAYGRAHTGDGLVLSV